MKRIGIDESTHDIYESSNGVWCSVWPATPVVSVAAFVDSDKVSPEFEHDLNRADTVFREDSYDPVTRIRRGRFYRSSGDSRPSQQHALLHPVYGTRGSPSSPYASEVERRLFTFDQLQHVPPDKIVVIGSSASLWRLLGAERITTREYLVTLKARHALGVLPELNSEAIPEDERVRAIETFEKLIDSAHREIPVNVVDRARDVTQWFLGTWLAAKNGNKKLLHDDLDSLIKKIDEHKQLSSSVANAIRLLHSRGKPNVQEKHSTRALMESDAEFALATVGLLLRELEWTR